MEDKPLSEICSFCDIKLRSHFEYEAHIMGQRHRYEVKKEIMKEQHMASAQGRSLPPTEYSCRLCYTTYLGAVSYFDHLVTRHRRKSPCRETEIRVCRICNIEYRDRSSFNQHLGSQYHRQAVRRRKEATGHSSRDRGYNSSYSRGSYQASSSADSRRPYASSSSAGYQCRLCDAFQRTRELLEAHMWSEHPHASKMH